MDIAVVEILLSDQVHFQINLTISLSNGTVLSFECHLTVDISMISYRLLKLFSANYGTPDFERLHSEANEDTWIIPMIETVQAIGTVRTLYDFLDSTDSFMIWGFVFADKFLSRSSK